MIRERSRSVLESLAIVSARYPPYVGGVETHVSQLAQKATKFFRRVSVITTDPQGHLPSVENVDDCLTIFRIRSLAPRENFHFPSLASLFKVLKQSHAQVLHLHSLQDVTGPIAGIMRGDSSVIFTPHYAGRQNSAWGKILFGAYRPFIRELVAHVPRIICISRFEARLIKDTFPESEGKLEIIPNGIATDLREKNQWLEPEEPTILYAGRLEWYKNVDKVMRAVAKLRKKNDKLRLRIVGQGPIKNELQQLSRMIGLNGSVEWYDRLPQSELFPLYASSTAVVLASDYENWGNTVAESIGVGVPTIVANASSLAEFVEEGLAVPVEPPIDEVKLASKIGEVIDDPKSFSPKGKRSPLIISWDEAAEKTFAPCLSQVNS